METDKYLCRLYLYFGSMDRIYDKIDQSIIDRLVANGCKAENWDNVRFNEDVDTDRLRNVTFLGTCNINVSKRHNYSASDELPGIYNATLKDCSVCDGVLIKNVGDVISNYVIECDTVIVNVGSIVCEKDATFGIGTPVAVLNENGGRSIPLSPKITAQTAYFASLYRHDEELTNKMSGYLSDYNVCQCKGKGSLGKGTIIIGCREIKNVYIEGKAELRYCSKLENGYIKSIDGNVFVGNDVMASDFVFMPGSQITNAAIVERCFVGEGTQIGNGFSATDCVFCSNCQAFHGEACSVFAGPFTVTHHKSTLLIAGMFSFMNAGSNTNQSNHYYRLGPNHEGILQRGSKTASGSYILWPAITGVFSLVKGKHGGNLDTRTLPFSYLIEQNGETWIFPGMSLKSSGTARDITKWEKRDKRNMCPEGLSDWYYQDVINFDIRSPFVMQQVLDGIDFLEKKQHHQRKEGVNYHKYGRAKMHSVAVDEGLDLYNYFLYSYVSHVFQKEKITPSRLIDLAKKDNGSNWIDVCGMWARKSDVDALLGGGSYADSSALKKINESFANNRLEWTAAMVLRRFFANDVSSVTQVKIDELISKGVESQDVLDKLVETDKQREYSDFMRVGYGMDGDKETAALDFSAVQGF